MLGALTHYRLIVACKPALFFQVNREMELKQQSLFQDFLQNGYVSDDLIAGLLHCAATPQTMIFLLKGAKFCFDLA